MVLKNDGRIFMRVVITLVFVATLAGGASYFKYNRERSQAIPEITTLTAASEQERQELVDLYNKRVDFLLGWEKSIKATNSKNASTLSLPAPVSDSKKLNPKTDAEFIQYDIVQNEISNQISVYLSSEDALKKRPAGLEKIEEQINRKRHEYHEHAFKADALIKKYDPKAKSIPVYAAEKAIYQQGLWK